MVTATQNLTTLFRVAGLLNCSPEKVCEIAEELAMVLPLRLNDTLHFDEDQVEQIRQYLAVRNRTKDQTT